VAGKKMRSRSGNAHNRKYAESVRGPAQRKNTARRQETHKKNNEKQDARASERGKLLSDCITKYHCNTYLIKRLIGTPSIKRLKSLLDESFISAVWFTNRKAIPLLRDKIVGTSIKSYMIDAMKQPEENAEKALHDKRNNKGTGTTKPE